MNQELKDILQRNNIDVEVVKEWTEGGEVLSIFQNDYNLCLLVKFKHDEESNLVIDPKDEYSFQRYFTIGDETVCSVDKTFTEIEAATLVGRLLNNKHK